MAATHNAENISRFILAGHPILLVRTYEEARAETAIREAATLVPGPRREIYSWSCTSGMVGDAGPIEGTGELEQSLNRVLADPSPALYLFVDVHHFLPSSPRLIRVMRDVYRALRSRPATVVLISPKPFLPEDLARDVVSYDLRPPDFAETASIVEHYLSVVAKSGKVRVGLSVGERRRFAQALAGLGFDAIHFALNRALAGEKSIGIHLLERLHHEKAEYCRSVGVLEFVPPRNDLEDLGGLDRFKDWLDKRRVLFDEEVSFSQTLLPRGILLMGISGCGKSLAVKTIGSAWDLPLFRLDFGLIFSGAYGAPEEALDAALRMAEAMAPVLLWVDEIEMGLGGHVSGTTGTAARVFASFLTWLQERETLVFVAATANRVDLLPAELLRKGRFDQIFFVDLPTENERVDIFRIQLATRGVDLTGFDFRSLAKSTRGWNGAEIEQAVAAAIVEARNDGLEVGPKHLMKTMSLIVPLSRTMEEQIRHIRSWAHDRAMNACTARDRRLHPEGVKE